MQQLNGPVQVDAKHRLPLFRRVLPGLGDRTGDAGAVDENVDLAEGGEGLVAGALDGGIVGDIDADCDDLAAAGKFLRRPFGERAVAIPDRHACAVAEQALDNGAADALGAAGHNRSACGKVISCGHGGLMGGTFAILVRSCSLEQPRAVANDQPTAASAGVSSSSASS